MKYSISPQLLFAALAFPVVAGAAGTLGVSPLTHVPSANPKAPGLASANALSPELIETRVATGAQLLENPSALTHHYGYDNNGPLLPIAPNFTVEASKSEPDKNTYLVLRGQHGADPSYNYGTHFLYQGHETGTAGYITRINLDADAAHRVTLLADHDVAGAALPFIDGSSWYPQANVLLFSGEEGLEGGMWQATPDFPSTVTNLTGIFGIGSYEGIQADVDGNIWVVEDEGGSRGAVNVNARQPNSFVYRFVPRDRSNLLAGGVLQALQVRNKANTAPIVFHAGQADADILSQDQFDLHQYRNSFNTAWVTVHDTAVDGFAPFNANAAAKTRLATPFKRPENGQFRPGSAFREFYFDETGDTDTRTQAGANYGGFGSVMVLEQSSPSAATGRLRMIYRGDVVHTGFDNVAFWSDSQVVFAEDAGDTLHTQRNALDSMYMLDVRADYSNAANQPVRIYAEGRDASATLDSALLGQSGFQNSGDNEITGIHISDGDATVFGLLGFKRPRPFVNGWRVFYTQQHGDNTTWEILPRGRNNDFDDRRLLGNYN